MSNTLEARGREVYWQEFVSAGFRTRLLLVLTPALCTHSDRIPVGETRTAAHLINDWLYQDLSPRIAIRSGSRSTFFNPDSTASSCASLFSIRGTPKRASSTPGGNSAVVVPVAVPRSNSTSRKTLLWRHFRVAVRCVNAYFTSITRLATLPGVHGRASRMLCRMRRERQRRFGNYVVFQATPPGNSTVKCPMSDWDWRSRVFVRPNRSIGLAVQRCVASRISTDVDDDHLDTQHPRRQPDTPSTSSSPRRTQP